MVTWSWHESHYYDTDSDGNNWCESEVVFIPEGGSIARYILQKYKGYVADETVYTREERGMSGYGVGCCLSSLVLLAPDGQKISGFKPKSIAHLCRW